MSDQIVPQPDFDLNKADILAGLESFDTSQYSKTRNHVAGQVSYLSPYISRGLITLPEVKVQVLENNSVSDSYKFIFELAWREYYQRVWQAKGDGIFSDLKSEQRFESKKIPTSVLNHRTGINTLDAATKALQRGGYMHNHARMWTAGLVTNIAHTWWKTGADWMYYHLLDGDLASNYLSWQWVAGTFSNKQYVPQQGNINKYSNSNQKNTYLDQSYEKLNHLNTIPETLDERCLLNLPIKLGDSKISSLNENVATLIYHHYWLNPDWNPTGEDIDKTNRILVLEPSHFKQHPVSSKVINFTKKLAQENIKNIQIYVGEYSDFIKKFNLNTEKCYYVNHPITKNWQGKHTNITDTFLFPEVEYKFYPSFSKFWNRAEPVYKSWE